VAILKLFSGNEKKDEDEWSNKIKNHKQENKKKWKITRKIKNDVEGTQKEVEREKA
jgi:adenosyl cobinamide kinase/adenosyl cobinamide phosphate guanylyltransferase